MGKSVLAIFIIITSVSVFAANNHHSKYAGEQNRTIKSLSSDDINELLSGGGWGFAKAAELNGLPGPKHLLDMDDEISLSSEQKAQIEELFLNMQEKAIELGGRLVSLEQELNNKFASNDINKSELEDLLTQIGEVRTKLRFVHLFAHLKTPEILTSEQQALYVELRGYSNDPCANVPKGHNEEMWKKHNNCN